MRVKAGAIAATALLPVMMLPGCLEEPPCSKINEGLVPKRCWHEWIDAEMAVLLHQIELHLNETNHLVVEFRATNFSNRTVLLDRAALSPFPGGLDFIQLDDYPLYPGDNLLFNKTMREPQTAPITSIYIDLTFRGSRHEAAYPAVNYSNSCLKEHPGDSSLLVHDATGLPKDCSARMDESSPWESGIHFEASNGQGLKVWLPGPHRADFWYRHCAPCFDGYPPEKLVP